MTALLRPDDYQPAPPPKKDYRIAFVGFGGIVRMAHLPAYRNFGYNVVAACDVSEEARKAARDVYGIPFVTGDLDALLERDDIDIIDLAVHADQRLPLVERIVRAKKPILSQKPFAMKMEDASTTSSRLNRSTGTNGSSTAPKARSPQATSNSESGPDRLSVRTAKTPPRKGNSALFRVWLGPSSPRTMEAPAGHEGGPMRRGLVVKRTWRVVAVSCLLMITLASQGVWAEGSPLPSADPPLPGEELTDEELAEIRGEVHPIVAGAMVGAVGAGFKYATSPGEKSVKGFLKAVGSGALWGGALATVGLVGAFAKAGQAVSAARGAAAVRRGVDAAEVAWSSWAAANVGALEGASEQISQSMKKK